METYQEQLARKTAKIKEAIERQKDMLKLYREGKSMREIGERYGLTRARVSQIILMAKKRP